MDGCEWMDGLDDPYQSYPTLLNQIYSMIYTISMPFIIVSRPIPRRYRALLSNYARYVYHDIECQHWFAWIFAVIKIWSNAVNERVEDVTSVIVRVLPLRIPLCIYI